MFSICQKSALLTFITLAAVAATSFVLAAGDASDYTLSAAFATRKAELTKELTAQIDAIAAEWQGRDVRRVRVTGHTDDVPIAERNRQEFDDNFELSEARARSVAIYLASALGIERDAIEVVGQGAIEPVASNATASGRAQNRRVEIRIESIDAVGSMTEPAEAAAPVAVAPASNGVLERAQALLNEGRADEAETLLAPYEYELAGNMQFDYLYGLALLETGQPGAAAFSLERATVQDPEFVGARLDLARAYYELDLLEDAEREFSSLAALGPPPAARAAIDDYLTAIKRRRNPLRDRKVVYFDGSTGFDTNANSATDVNQFLGFNLAAASRESDSPFFEVGGGGFFGKTMRPGWYLDNRFDLRHRSNTDASFVDSTTGSLNIALRNVHDESIRSVGVNAFRQHIDNDFNVQGVSLFGQWNRGLPRNWRLAVTGRVGALRYDDDLEIKDVDQYQLGGTVSRPFGADNQGLWGGSVILGADDAVNDGSRYSRDIYGGRLFGSWAFSERLRGRFQVGNVSSDYDEVFFESLFDSPREDDLLEFSAAFDWRLKNDWVLVPSLSYYDNSTDVDIYDYDRIEARFLIRKNWD